MLLSLIERLRTLLRRLTVSTVKCHTCNDSGVDEGLAFGKYFSLPCGCSAGRQFALKH